MTVQEQIHASKGKMHLTGDQAVNLLVCFEGYLGAVCIEPPQKERDREAGMQRGGQAGIQKQTCREIALCSLGKHLH